MYRLIFLVTLLLSLAVAQNDRTARIVGGRNAGAGEAPYQVSLRAFGSTFHFCGGALISNRWTVTAATCVYGRARNSINVMAGTVSLRANGVSRRSANIVVHHMFFPSGIDNNIALIQTAAFPLNQNIWPVALGSSIIRFEVPAVISGFGATDFNAGPNSDQLQILFLATASDADCSEAYGDNINLEVNICTDNGVGEGFCTSDMGGPLVSNGQLIGIANWNIPCGQGFMDIFTRISFYRMWIGGVTGI